MYACRWTNTAALVYASPPLQCADSEIFHYNGTELLTANDVKISFPIAENLVEKPGTQKAGIFMAT